MFPKWFFFEHTGQNTPSNQKNGSEPVSGPEQGGPPRRRGVA